MNYDGYDFYIQRLKYFGYVPSMFLERLGFFFYRGGGFICHCYGCTGITIT
jgi:hypothetical protein